MKLEQKKLIDLKAFIIFGMSVITISNLIFVLFSQTIPNVVLSFFKDASGAVILGAVFVFAIIWVIKAKPHNKPKNYSVIPYDVFGKETKIDGLRLEFKNHDVAWSFMKQYKKSYPLHNFALVSDGKKLEKQTIFRYI